jgi:hypothetical protein
MRRALGMQAGWNKKGRQADQEVAEQEVNDF